MGKNKPKMDWRLWGKKTALAFIAGGVVSVISMLEAVPIDPTQAFYMTVVLASLRSLGNFIKHIK